MSFGEILNKKGLYEYLQSYTFNVGDDVRVMRNFEKGELGFAPIIDPLPVSLIGEIAVITAIKSYCVEITFESGDVGVVPFFILKLIKRNPPTEQDYERWIGTLFDVNDYCKIAMESPLNSDITGYRQNNYKKYIGDVGKIIHIDDGYAYLSICGDEVLVPPECLEKVEPPKSEKIEVGKLEMTIEQAELLYENLKERLGK